MGFLIIIGTFTYILGFTTSFYIFRKDSIKEKQLEYIHEKEIELLKATFKCDIQAYKDMCFEFIHDKMTEQDAIRLDIQTAHDEIVRKNGTLTHLKLLNGGREGKKK